MRAPCNAPGCDNKRAENSMVCPMHKVIIHELTSTGGKDDG